MRRVFQLISLLLVALAVRVEGAINRWTPAGPEGVGIFSIVAGDGVLYAITSTGQVARSSGSTNWKVVSESLCLNCSTRLMADPFDSAVVYAMVGGGFYKSSDGGEHWRKIQRPEYLSSLVADPRHRGVLYGATNGEVFRSVDSGETWQRAGSVGIDATITCLVVSRAEPPRIYAATFAGLFASDDEGLSWNQIVAGIPVREIALNRADENAIVIANEREVRESADGGATWRPVPLPTWLDVPFALSFDADGRALLIGTPGRLLRAVRLGEGWNVSLVLAVPEIYSLALGTDDRTLYAGSRTSGLFKSIDAGVSWERTDFPLGQCSVNHAVVDQESGAVVVAADCGVFRSSDRGTNWTALNPTLGRAFALAADPAQKTLLACNYYRTDKSTDGGLTWTGVTPDPRIMFGASAVGISAADPATMYAVLASSIFRSTDGGVSWLGSQQGLMPSYYGFFAQDIVVDPEIPTTVFAPTTEWLYMSDDGGKSWRRPSGVGLGNFRSLAIDPANSLHILTAVTNAFTDSGLFESFDGGEHWKRFPWAVPAGLAIIRFDSLDSNRLYAACDEGVAVTYDRGLNWSLLDQGWARTGIGDLIVDSRRRLLYAATPLGLYLYEFAAPPRRRSVGR